MTTLPDNEDNSAGFEFWLRFWKIVVAAVEVLGGLFGTYVVTFGNVVGSSRVVLLLAFTYFIAAVWAGILLAFNKPRGVIVSLVIQALQLFQISAAGIFYSLGCGLQLLVGFYPSPEGTNLSLGGQLGSKFLVFFNPPPVEVPSANGMVVVPVPSMAITGINVVALLAIICLILLRSHRKPPSQTLSLKGAASEPSEQENVWPPMPGSP